MHDNPLILNAALLEEYRRHLLEQERSAATAEKYLCALERLRLFLAGRSMSKQLLIEWKACLSRTRAPATVNTFLAAANGFLRYLGRSEWCLRFVKVQRQLFCPEERLLTREEYTRLVLAAEKAGDHRFSLLLQTMCATGVRVSEVRHITAEAVQTGRAVVRCKNKTRVIFLPGALRKKLRAYLRDRRITTGPVFRTRTGSPLDRFYIWRRMKALCDAAGVCREKVFPHNLRHLFARSFYALERDIVRLADLMGHSSINTTRIYTLDSGESHLRSMDRLAQRLLTT